MSRAAGGRKQRPMGSVLTRLRNGTLPHGRHAGTCEGCGCSLPPDCYLCARCASKRYGPDVPPDPWCYSGAGRCERRALRRGER